MGEEIDHIQPAYLGLFQKIGRLRFLLTEDGHQHVGAADLSIAGGLHMEDSTLQHPLEAKRGLGFSVFIIAGNKRGCLTDECADLFAHQFHISTTRTQRLKG